MRRSCCTVLAVAAFICASSFAASAQENLNILTLGDSITYGYSYDGTNVLGVTPSGYRGYLQTDLSSQGITANFVGVNTGNGLATDGFGGYTISEITANLAGTASPAGGVSNQGGDWLTSAAAGQPAPQVILVMAGTNDFLQQYDPNTNLANPMGTVYPYEGKYTNNTVFASDAAGRFGLLLNELVTLEPQATIIVGSTLPFFEDPRVAFYNADVKAMIASPTYANDHIYFADFYDSFSSPSRSDLLNWLYDSGDGIHPNAAGYEEMGTLWDNAILTDYDFADAAASVPEPSTWALLIGGVLALAGWRRLRPRKS